MSETREIWLVRNETSGSNDEEALAALEGGCGDAGLVIRGQTCFPKEDFPLPADLERAGVGTVAVFAGDGTINALVRHFAGWGGRILVLAGGTMNLLYHRLHGHREVQEVLAMVARGECAVRRPGVIRCPQGEALAGLLAGPGTSWYDVREAMRDADPLGVADGAAQAIEDTLGGPAVMCRELGRKSGYPLIMLTPHDDAIEVTAFHSETLGDYLSQGWALLRRNFREGPHDPLGRVRQLTLASTDGAPFGILLDGEKAEAPSEEKFVLAPSEVDLLATDPDE